MSRKHRRGRRGHAFKNHFPAQSSDDHNDANNSSAEDVSQSEAADQNDD